MPNDILLEVGKDISKEEYDRQLENLKAANAIFSGIMGADSFKDQFDRQYISAVYTSHTADELDRMARSKKFHDMRVKASRLSEINKIYGPSYLKEYVSSTGKFRFARSRHLAADISYMLPGHEGDKDRLIEENKAAMKDLATVKGRQKFYKKLMDSFEKMDLSKLDMSNPESLLDFYTENYQALTAGFVFKNDVLPAMMEDGEYTPERQAIWESKWEDLQAIGGFIGPYMSMMATDYYPVFPGHELATLIAVNHLPHFDEKNAADGVSAETMTAVKNDISSNLMSIYGIVTVMQEMKDAEKWFESLKSELTGLDGNMKYDPSDKLYALRFHPFNAKASKEEDEYELLADKDMFGNEYGHLKNDDFIDKTKPLDQFTIQEKLSLYRNASKGELLLYPGNGDILTEKAIYIKQDGTAGVSKGYTADVTLENHELQNKIADNPDFCKEIFPDAAKPDKLAEHVGQYCAARTQYVWTGQDKAVLYSQKTKSHFAILKDIKDNPEYYASRELSNERINTINQYYMGKLAIDNDVAAADTPENVETYKNHPVEKSVALNGLLKDQLKKNNAPEKMTIKESIEKGHIKINADLKQFSAGSKPWEFDEKLASAIADHKADVYMPFVDPRTNRKTVGKVVVEADSMKIKPAKLLPEKDVNSLKDALSQVKNCLMIRALQKMIQLS